MPKNSNTDPKPQCVQTDVMQSVISLSELRIGNYYYWNAEGKNYLMKVDAKDFSNENYRNFDIVPLTEELISNICFNENKVIGMYRLEATEDYSISFSLDNDMIYIGDDIEIRISETPLHRFQNIYFSLTARELTVA